MRTSTALKKRIARVLNELTEIKLDLGASGIEIPPEDAEYIVNEAERIKNAAHRISIKVLDIAEATTPFIPARHR
jgi:hypothetical protein